MTAEEYTRRVADNKRRSEFYTEVMMSADAEDIYPLLRDFIACRYFLDDADMTSDNLVVLGNRSTEKLAELRRGGLETADRSVGCTSAPSAVTKKALLILTLGRLLHIKFDPDEAAEAATIAQLAALINQNLRTNTHESATHSG